MAKNKTVYVCRDCGFDAPKWSGQCPNCGAWNTLSKMTVSKSASSSKQSSSKPLRVTTLSEVKAQDADRRASGISEFDRVLGGGLVPGQVILLTGEPGIGKSTLLLQVADAISKGPTSMEVKPSGNDKSEVEFRGSAETPKQNAVGVLYVSGEESPNQIKLRANRLGVQSESINLLAETTVESILDIVNNQPSYASLARTSAATESRQLVIVDSVQTLTASSSDSAAGTVSQVRDSAQALGKWAKEAEVPLILVGHVTKAGSVAGPKVLEHLVDTVLFLEGDKFRQFRLLRSLKNRFGSVDEVGVFKMGEEGMQEVSNPSDMFLSERQESSPGSVVTVVMEGTRPMLLEIQALVTPSPHSQPRRVASGFSYKRLLMLCAVLEKSLGLSLNSKDVYVNVASGAKVKEPAADLAVVSALYSSLKNKPAKENTVVFGEVGLSGEVRTVAHAKRRVQEGEKLGYENVIGPDSVRSIKQVVVEILNSKS